MSFYLYCPFYGEKTARLPRKSDAQRQREGERMLCAVGLDVAIRRDIVLQAWFHEEADVGCQVVLQAKAEARGELPWNVDGGLVAGFIQTIYIVVGLEGRVDGDFGCQAETAVQTPLSGAIHIIQSFHWYAKIMYRLSLFDFVAIFTHLKFRSEFAVVQASFKTPTMIQFVFKCQRPCDWHLVMACTKDFAIARTVGIAQRNAHDDATGLFTCCIRVVGQINGIVAPIVDAARNRRTRTRV